MRRVLLICSSTDGQTRRICDRLRAMLEAAGNAVTLVAIEEADAVSPEGFDVAVIGARIRYGRTDKRVIAYADRHAARLDAMESAFFSVNLVARKRTRNLPHTNPYVRHFLRRVAWRPRRIDVFAGRIDYSLYGPLDRWVIRLIMALTGGPTRADAVVEYTDWGRVEAFGRELGGSG